MCPDGPTWQYWDQHLEGEAWQLCALYSGVSPDLLTLEAVQALVKRRPKMVVCTVHDMPLVCVVEPPSLEARFADNLVHVEIAIWTGKLKVENQDEQIPLLKRRVRIEAFMGWAKRVGVNRPGPWPERGVVASGAAERDARVELLRRVRDGRLWSLDEPLDDQLLEARLLTGLGLLDYVQLGVSRLTSLGETYLAEIERSLPAT